MENSLSLRNRNFRDGGAECGGETQEVERPKLDLKEGRQMWPGGEEWRKYPGLRGL